MAAKAVRAKVLAVLVQNPRTTAGAIAAMFAAGVAITNDWTVITKPEFWMSVISALTLLAAADAKGRGPEPPQPPSVP